MSGEPLPLAHLITNFAARGGAETMLARLVSARPERPVLVVSLREISADNRSLIDHPAVEYVALQARSALDLAAATWRLRALLEARRPQALLCWMYHAHVAGAVAGRLARQPRVYWNVRSSLDREAYLAASTKLALAASGLVSGWADGIIFNSRTAIANHRPWGYRHANTVVLPNGYVLPPPPDLSPRAHKVFGIAARFHPEKDYETFLGCAGRVMAARPDARLVVAGRGAVEANPEFAALLDRFAIDRSRLTLMDELTDMTPFYRAIDVNVLSSRMEGFPNVVAEGMSHGAPCVSTDVGDAAYIIGDTGATAPARDPEGLAARVLELMAMSPDEFATRRAAARARIEQNFEIGVVAGRYDDVVLHGAAA